MNSSHKVMVRMEERVRRLSQHFTEYLDFFDGSGNFVGPSVYFHNKTLAIRNSCRTVEATLSCDVFFDYLYATLTAWGLHRMGPGNTKLRDIEDLKSSFRLQAEAISQLDKFVITEIPKVDAPKVAGALWGVLSQLKVSVAEAQIVANSKALHHLMPSLVPPIDRTYTFNFLYDRTTLTMEESEAFQEMFLRFHFIALTNKVQIRTCLGKGWNTSETKTIDNAIVEFVVKELR